MYGELFAMGAIYVISEGGHGHVYCFKQNYAQSFQQQKYLLRICKKKVSGSGVLVTGSIGLAGSLCTLNTSSAC